MKHLILAITLLSGTLFAQSVSVSQKASPGSGPSYSQMYCSGFITRDAIPRTIYVVGSKESPHEDQFGARTQLVIEGQALVEGQKYSILRQVEDPDKVDSSPEERKELAKLGKLYQEIGWVTVQTVHKDASIASFDFACDSTVRGDILVPYVEKPTITFRAMDQPMAAFRPAPGAVHGKIVGAKNFDSLLGTGQIVYTDLGSEKGVKAGDYLVITRGYSAGDLNKIDRASESLPKGLSDTSVNPAVVKPEADDRIPHRVLGELLVLNTTHESSTAIVTRAMSEIGFGDVIENESDSQPVSTEPAKEAATEPAPCHPSSFLQRVRHLQLHACK